METWKKYLDANKGRFLDELVQLLKIPSVSARNEHRADMSNCAEAVKEHLLKAGADKAVVHTTAGHPIVYAEKIIDASLPTILVYGHYDVQPPDPLNLWDSPPFEPIIKDGNIFARGACDDKGQVYMHVKAFEMMNHTATLPCNIKFIIEGEEEVGSSSLGPFIINNKEKLKANKKIYCEANKETIAIKQKAYRKANKEKIKEVKKIYEKGRKDSLNYFEEIYHKLGTRFMDYFFESSTGEIGTKIIKESPFFKESEGAIIWDGKEIGHNIQVLINRYGIPTYGAKEIGLNLQKKQKYHPDLSIVCTAKEQEFYFKDLIEIFKQLGFSQETIHLAHGELRLTTGKMSFDK